ncbi:hypothetical protein EV175_002354 [Coemansia sp. RSA 1933]|nr:hypothetical protein EV175_002354 [Coemansia sp. RSA 1933]
MVIADHDGYPTIPEFGGDYTTGLSYYENSANVTVTGSGPYTSNYNAVKANADPAQESVVSNTDPTQGSIVSNTDPTQDNIFNIVNIVTTTAMPAELEVDDPVEATDADLGSTDSDIDDEDNAGASDVESNIDSDVESSVDSEIESDGGNGCTNGAMSCASDSSGYEICVLGNIVSIPCGTGTVCKGTYGAIYCGWP